MNARISAGRATPLSSKSTSTCPSTYCPPHQCYESLLSGAQSTILAAYVAARSGFSRLVNVVIHGTQAHTLKASVVCRVEKSC